MKSPKDSNLDGRQSSKPLTKETVLEPHVDMLAGEAFSSATRPSSEMDLHSLRINGQEYTALAQGMQARVYIHSDQIVKVGHTLEQAIQIFQKAGHSDAEKDAHESVAHWTALVREVREHIASGRLDPGLISGTRIDHLDRVWQDRTPPVELTFDPEKIGSYDPQSIRSLIDKFAEHALLMWKCGAHETERSLFTNYGLHPTDGVLTSPDFGNVTFSYNQARDSIQGTVTTEDVEAFLSGKPTAQKESWPDWFYKGQVREALKAHPDLFQYYVTKMSEALSMKKLELSWPQKFR